MYPSDEIIRQLQNNKILALQVDRVVTGVRDVVLEQVTTIGAGAIKKDCQMMTW